MPNCSKQIPQLSTSDPKRVPCKHYLSSTDLISTGLCMLRDEFLCTIDFNSTAPRLSHSSVTDWLTCKRLYWLKNVKGIEVLNAAKSPALKMGALWDTCIGVLLGQAEKSSIPALINRFEIAPRDVAKVRALYRAIKILDISLDSICQFQSEFILPLKYRDTSIEYVIKGILDRYYPDGNYFAETKLSSKPAWYETLFNIVPQCGTYFLSNPDLKYVTLEIARPPDLKSIGKFSDEDDQSYEDRCLKDILNRPAWYFLGYTKESKTFGKKFYRTEFPLDEIKSRLESVFFEILQSAELDSFYKNYRSCYSPFQCDYLSICQYDTWSEEIYRIKPKPNVEPKPETEGGESHAA